MEGYPTPSNEYSDPAELALPHVDVILSEPTLNGTNEEHRVLAKLDREGSKLGFHDKRYFVKAQRSVCLPLSFESDEPVEYRDFRNKMMFFGILATYAIVQIDHLAVAESNVRALCLVFCPFILIPSYGEIGRRQEERYMLYTPVLAIEDITQEDPDNYAQLN